MRVPISNQPQFRKLCAVAIFLAAALVQVFFKNLPWPLTIESASNLHNPSAALGAKEIVITKAVVSPHHELLSYQGNPFETVDLDFDNARLDDHTEAFLASFPPAPPTAPSAWHFITHEDHPADSSETCRAALFINVTGGPAKESEFHLLQLGEPGLNRMRSIELRTDEATLGVSVKTAWPEGKENKALGCHKRLQSGAWFRGIVNHPIQFVMMPHSLVRINFVSLSPGAPQWGGPDRPFKAAELGPLLARQLALRPIQEDGSSDKGPPSVQLSAYRSSQLKISDLEVGSDSIQVSASGTAWATVDGQTQGFDLWDAMQKNAMFAALLTGVNALLLAWLHKLFFGAKPKPPVTQAEPQQ